MTLMNWVAVNRSWWPAVFAAVLACGLLQAQEGGDKPKKDPPPADGNTASGAREKFKDPTAGSARLEEALQPAPAERAVAAAPVVRVPEIVLKAYLHAEGKAPSAIIEIKGKGTTTVHDGTQVTITGEGGGALTITVKKVAEESVIIEVPGLKDALIVK